MRVFSFLYERKPLETYLSAINKTTTFIHHMSMFSKEPIELVVPHKIILAAIRGSRGTH